MIAIVIGANVGAYLGFIWGLFRMMKRAAAAEAEIWQAIAELRQDHNALALSTADELRFESQARFKLECALINRGLIKDTRP